MHDAGVKREMIPRAVYHLFANLWLISKRACINYQTCYVLERSKVRTGYCLRKYVP